MMKEIKIRTPLEGAGVEPEQSVRQRLLSGQRHGDVAEQDARE